MGAVAGAARARTGPACGSKAASGWSTGGWRSSTSRSWARSRCATARLTIVFNGCIYNHHELRAELRALGHEFRLAAATPRCCSRAGGEWGEDLPNHLYGMFAFVLHATAGARSSSATGSASSRCTWPSPAASLRAASTLPALLAAGGVDTRVDPVALHHYLSWHSVVPAPRTILRGVKKLPPATIRVIEPDGAARDRVYWDPPFERRLDVDDWPDALREALQRRRPAPHGGRRPGRDPALRRPGLLADRRAARARGPDRAGDVLDRLRGRRRPRGRRVRVLRPDRARVRHRPPPAADRPPPARRTRCRRRSRP